MVGGRHAARDDGRRGIVGLVAAAAVSFTALSAPHDVAAQDAGLPTSTLSPVVVTATRTSRSPFDVAASIDRIDGDDVRLDRARINLSESLGGVPGLVARDRQNYAQDVQISVRGFGARASFGVRGVRLYVDGIPATLPDGQGQISNVELSSVDRIEVLRGPFSALYGNSSGGVLQVFTEEGRGTPRVEAGASTGSDASRRIGLRAVGGLRGDGGAPAFGYAVSASRFTTDGYRDHSAAERSIGNVKLTFDGDRAGKLTLIANRVVVPEAEDPLGLTRAQFEADPRGVDPAALKFDTRKSFDQTQAGLTYERAFDGGHALRALVYAGRRSAEQFQSIPVAVQAGLLHPGGVIALDRDYAGADVRWRWRGEVATTPLSVVAGLSWDALREHREGYTNFSGSELGVRGELRRDERNRVSNLDPYVQLAWMPAPGWTVDAGVRRSRVRFVSSDAYVAGPNPDDSGRVAYSATLPVLGVMVAASDDVHPYATIGRGFETPTLNELAYRPGGGTGLNLALKASRSTSVEAGVKTRIASVGDLNAAVFQTDTDDEIVTQTNVGGRSTYRNAGATRRRGLEVSWTRTAFGAARADVAYTLLDARYRDAFVTCSASPCTTPTLAIPAGNRLPGIARTTWFASLAWRPATGLRGGVELRASSRVWVDDANSDAASGHAIAAATAGYGASVGAWRLDAFARADNLFARRIAGSVIVNEGNRRFFEPAPGRTWLLGATAALSF